MDADALTPREGRLALETAGLEAMHVPIKQVLYFVVMTDGQDVGLAVRLHGLNDFLGLIAQRIGCAIPWVAKLQRTFIREINNGTVPTEIDHIGTLICDSPSQIHAGALIKASVMVAGDEVGFDSNSIPSSYSVFAKAGSKEQSFIYAVDILSSGLPVLFERVIFILDITYPFPSNTASK